MSRCRICGEHHCKKHSFLLGKTRKLTEFSGSTPPEIFVGRWNYPNVYTGILSPEQHGETNILSSPEIWHKEKIQIPRILLWKNSKSHKKTTNKIPIGS